MTRAYIRRNIFKGYLFEDYNYMVVIEDPSTGFLRWDYIAIEGCDTLVGALLYTVMHKGDFIILDNRKK